MINPKALVCRTTKSKFEMRKRHGWFAQFAHANLCPGRLSSSCKCHHQPKQDKLLSCEQKIPKNASGGALVTDPSQRLRPKGARLASSFERARCARVQSMSSEKIVSTPTSGSKVNIIERLHEPAGGAIGHVVPGLEALPE